MPRLWTFGIAVALGIIGCVGGPGEPTVGTTGGGSSSSDSNSSGRSSSSSGASGTTTSSSSSSSSGGTSTTIRASDFDQACKVAADCAPIYQGDACSPCACPNAAIATSAASDYSSKVSTARASCGEIPAIACGPCANVTTLCAGGKCSVAIGIATDAGG